jgi:hypothetical protein
VRGCSTDEADAEPELAAGEHVDRRAELRDPNGKSARRPGRTRLGRGEGFLIAATRPRV